MKASIFKSLIILIGLLSLAQSDPTYQLFRIKDYSTGGMCLDGSFPALYFKNGTNKDKYMIFFEGGGWCGGQNLTDTIQDCYARSLTELGSSLLYPSTINPDGLLSTEQSKNPQYYDYNVVYLKYCDGTGFQGYKSDPVTYNKSQIWFRGENNTRFLIQYAMDSLGLSTASEVAVFGSSAGAAATYQWIDQIAAMFPSGQALVYGIADSGVFVDMQNYTSQQYNYRILISNFMQLSNNNFPPAIRQCGIDNPSQLWKCMMFQYIYQYIQSPVFVIQSQYDLWSIQNILGINCADQGTLTNCDEETTSYIEQMRSTMVTFINEYLTFQKQSGTWSIACINHGYCIFDRFKSDNYEVPQNSGDTVAESLTAWYAGYHQYYIDTVDWPSNKPCSQGQPDQ